MTDEKTRYGALADAPLDGGYPAEESQRTLQEELFFQRAAQVWLWALPAMNMYAMKKAQDRVAGTGYHTIAVYEQRLKPNTVITTPNADVIYGLAFADLSESGPLVIDAPPMLQALVDDFWHRPLTGPVIDGVQYRGDVGLPGPDHGKDGTYVIVPEGYDGEVPKDAFVYTSRTNGVFFFVRGFFKAVEAITIRRLHGETEPMRYEHVSDIPADALFPHDASYFDLLDEFIQGERIDDVDPYMHGMLATLGIVKGGSFAPSTRERELLEHASLTAWKMAKTEAATYVDQPLTRWWADRQWVAHVKTQPDDFMHTLLNEEFRVRTTGHSDVHAKAHMFVNHYSVSTGMMSSIVGLGAKYGNAYRDSDGDYLRGERTYRIDFPANPPAKLFWSLTVYDAASTSGVDAEGQTYPSLNGMNRVELNNDGSITLFVGPNPPEGATNWLKTVPGQGWFGIFRFYAPTQAYFDREYKVGDFHRID